MNRAVPVVAALLALAGSGCGSGGSATSSSQTSTPAPDGHATCVAITNLDGGDAFRYPARSESQEEFDRYRREVQRLADQAPPDLAIRLQVLADAVAELRIEFDPDRAAAFDSTRQQQALTAAQASLRSVRIGCERYR